MTNRKLNVNEKINFRYAFSRKGIVLPVITMGLVKHFWFHCYGYVKLNKNWLFSRGKL